MLGRCSASEASAGPFVTGLIATALLLLAGSPTAIAQRIQPSDPESAGRDRMSAEAQRMLQADLRFGPFHLRPSLGLRTGWETLAERDGEDGIRGQFVANVTPRLGILLPLEGSRHSLSMATALGYRWYRRSEGLRGLNPGLNVNYGFDASRWTFGLSYGVSWRKERFIDALNGDDRIGDLQPDEFPLDEYQLDVDERNRVLNMNTSADFRYNLGTRMFVQVGGTRRQIEYDDDARSGDILLADRLNRTQTGGSVGFGYEISSRTDASVFFDYRESSFDAEDSFRGNDRRRYGFQLGFTPLSTLRGTVRVGVTEAEPRSDSVQGQKTLYVNATVAMPLGSRARLFVRGRRDIQDTFIDNNFAAVRTGIGAGIDGQILSSLTVSLDANVFELSYPEEITEDVDGVPITALRDDRLNTVSAEIGWSFWYFRSLGVRATYYQRDSNFDEHDTDGLVVGTVVALRY